MNETIKTLLERRSIRAYEDRPVSREDLDLILRCGQYAATGHGLQPWHFTVITNRGILDELSAANRQILLADPSVTGARRKQAESDRFDSFRGAPMAILVSGENDGEMTIADCANATENMAIAAASLGLGSCYLASFKLAMLAPGGEKYKTLAGVPEGYVPLFALSLGYPAESPEASPRREGTVSYVR